MHIYFLWIIFVIISFNNRVMAGPEIDPIDDIIACSYYVLPPIGGSGLTSNAAYFNAPNGTGSKYTAGDTIFNSSILYAYDDDGTASDEECFYIQIINQLPDLTHLRDTISCTYFVLPYFTTPSVSGFAGYYTSPNAQGTRYHQGDTLFASQSLYAYDGLENCIAEQSFTVTIFEMPVFDSIETQFGCHEYTLVPFEGQHVFADSLYFFMNGQSLLPGDIIKESGTIDVLAKNGPCITINDFMLNVVDDIYLDPISDTFICDHLLFLPEITGTNVTNFARYYEQPNGLGEDHMPLRNLSVIQDKIVYAYDQIPGTDCWDEVSFLVEYNRKPWAYLDFSMTVCKGFTYDMYQLLLGRQIQVNLNRIEPIDQTIMLEDNKFFNTANYEEGTYQFYVIDTSASVCIPDTAILTVISTNHCSNEDYIDSVCVQPHLIDQLLMSNLVKLPEFCIGGYFTDMDFNFIGHWNDLFLLNPTVEHDFEFYYILQDPYGVADTSYILIKIVRNFPVNYSGDAALCKGECTELNIGFLDEDFYTVLWVYERGSGGDTDGFYFDSITRHTSIPVCFMNGRTNQVYENPDTLFLPFSNEQYVFETWALELKDCQSSGPPITISTLDENTQFFTQTLCPEEEITIEGHTFNAERPSGEILLDEPAFNGCDSFLYVQLGFYDSTVYYLKEEICDRDTVIINCVAYSKSFSRDTQILNNGSVFGCDSIIIIDLNFTLADTLEIDTVLCPDDFMLIGHDIYDHAGMFQGVIKKQNLCDSLIYNLDLSYALPPSFSLDISGFSCMDDTASISITSGSASVQWSTGDTMNQILVTNPGEYGVTITSPSGCQADTTFHLSAIETPEISGSYNYQTGIGIPVVPNLDFGESVSIHWSPSAGMDCDTCPHPVITITESQIFHFVATDENGCQLTGFITIEVVFDADKDIYIPNVINPDSDIESNRVLSVFTRGKERPYTMYIFDRWGNLLYENRNLISNDQGTGWNGRVNNRPVQSGVYTYKIKIEDISEPLTGTITVIY